MNPSGLKRRYSQEIHRRGLGQEVNANPVNATVVRIDKLLIRLTHIVFLEPKNWLDFAPQGDNLLGCQRVEEWPESET